MSHVLGMNAKLYRNTATYGTPTWDLVGNVRDLTLALTKDVVDVTTRGNNGWKAEVGTLKDGSVDFSMVWDTEDTDFTAMQTAFLAGTLIDFAVMDGDITTPGSQGLRAEFDIMTFSRNENLTEALMVDVSMKPGYSANAPIWHTVPTP